MSKFTLDWKQYAALARQAAAEGCVLLENKNNTLPLAEGETCAVFGRTQFEYYNLNHGMHEADHRPGGTGIPTMEQHR